MTAHRRHGVYELAPSTVGGKGMTIVRQDADRKRTVAFVERFAQWDRFVVALESGDDEVAAVLAIDAAAQGNGP